MAFKSEIRKIIEKNCEQDKYVELFSSVLQNDIRKNSDKLAQIVCEDEDLKEHIEDAIEDAVRIMILKSKKY